MSRIRRTGVATVVVSTIGIAMVNTTGIARSDSRSLDDARGAGATGALTTVPVVSGAGAVDSLSDPSLATPPGTAATAPGPDADMAELARHAEENRLALDEARASRAYETYQRRTAEHVYLESQRWVHPIAARLTQRFGGSGGHPGIDLGAPSGTPVVASHRGVVVYAGWQSGYGNLVQVLHDGDIVTSYGHLSRISVHVGQRVETGRQLGLEGSTGRSTGPHLHFEVRLGGLDGRRVDPLAWLAQHGVTY